MNIGICLLLDSSVLHGVVPHVYRDHKTPSITVGLKPRSMNKGTRHRSAAKRSVGPRNAKKRFSKLDARVLAGERQLPSRTESMSLPGARR